MSLATATFQFLLATTVLLHTIPLLACFLHLQWPLSQPLEIICRPAIAGRALSVINTNPIINSLTTRVSALEADIPPTLDSLITHLTALEADIPTTLNVLVTCVANLEANVPAMGTSPLFHTTNSKSGRQEIKPARNFTHFGDGARVLAELTSLTQGTKDNRWLQGSPIVGGLEYKNPPYVVSDDHMSIGSCWEIEGSSGVLGILLSEPIHISSMGINAIHPDLVSFASGAKTP